MNNVFSWAAGAATSSSAGAAAGAADAAAGAKPPIGISGMLRRVCRGDAVSNWNETRAETQSLRVLLKRYKKLMGQRRLTLSDETRSAVSRSVN